MEVTVYQFWDQAMGHYNFRPCSWRAAQLGKARPLKGGGEGIPITPGQPVLSLAPESWKITQAKLHTHRNIF